jgi:hypothetical protein
MQRSYRKTEQTLTIANAEAATGVLISGVLVTPDQLVTWDLPDATTAEEFDALDLYMADNGYAPAFPTI